MSDEVPAGFSVDVRQELRDVIYRIEPGEVPLVAASARLGARQVMDEYARGDPRFAAELRKHRREMKARQRERDQLADEMNHKQIPFFVATLNPPGSVADAAWVVLKVSDFLFDNDAPAGLIRDLLRVARQWLPE